MMEVDVIWAATKQNWSSGFLTGLTQTRLNTAEDSYKVDFFFLFKKRDYTICTYNTADSAPDKQHICIFT